MPPLFAHETAVAHLHGDGDALPALQRVQAAGHDGVIAHQHLFLALIGIAGGGIDVSGDTRDAPEVGASLRGHQRGVAEVRHQHIGVLLRVNVLGGGVHRHLRIAAQQVADVDAAGHIVKIRGHIVGRQLIFGQPGEVVTRDEVENGQHRLIAVGDLPRAAQVAVHGGQCPVVPLPARHTVHGGDGIIVQRGRRLSRVLVGHAAVGVVLPQVFQQRHGGVRLVHLRQRAAAVGPHPQSQRQCQGQEQDQRGEQCRPPLGPEGGADAVAGDHAAASHCTSSPPDTTAPSRSSSTRSALAASAMSWVTTMTQ